MIGRRYYLTTLAAWQRHAALCAETHFVVLEALQGQGIGPASSASADHVQPSCSSATLIFALISADEATHIALENDAEIEALPHPLARTSVSHRVAAALAHLGVASGDDTFTVAEKLARMNPLLRHRVF